MLWRAFLAGAMALALSVSAAAQDNQGTSPLSGRKGGTGNAFMQFTGPATSIKTYTLPNASDTIATLTGTQTLTNKTFNCANNTCTVRIGSDVTGLGTGIATFLATPSSANLRAALTDETGTGIAYFVGGALGTPSSATLTNATGLPIATGVSGLGTGVATALATPSSANVAAAVTDETGSGALVFGTSPTLTTPNLGTPSAATLTNATGLPIATGVSGLGTGIATFLATPSSANLRAALTDETGTGIAYFVGGALGTPSSATLTNATGLPISTGVSGLAANVAAWLATSSSANLAAALTDETGTGANVFANSPVLVTPNLGTPSAATLTNATGLPVSTGISGLGTGVATLLATPSSANLAAALTDETGTGANVFANSPTLTGSPDLQGTLKVSGFVTSTQITANQNNYTATDGSNTCSTKLVLRVSSNASRNVSGLSCGQAEGDLRILHNVGAQNIVLTNQDTNSTATNRFLLAGDVTLGADTSITIRYDGVTQRWRAITTPGAGGGGGGVTSVTIASSHGIAVSGTCTVTTTGTCTVAAADGVTLQTVYAQYTAHTTGTTSMSGGSDTIPQNTDGTEILTVAITPKLSTSKLNITVTLPVTSAANVNMWAAVFQDSTAAALTATSIGVPTAETIVPVTFSYQMTAGTTSSTTFKLRIGNVSGSTTWAVNGVTGGRRLGGANKVTITVSETKA